MRNLYISLAMGIACLSALDAAAYKVTVEVDNPAAVNATMNGSAVIFNDGVAEIEYDSYDYLSFSSVDPYVFVSLQEYSPSSGSWNSGYLNSAKNHSLSLSGEYTDGYKYKFTTGNLDELRTAKVTLKVDDPSAIQFMRSWTNETITPTQTETEIRYVPGKETPFAIATVSGKNLYKLTVAGAEVQGSYGRYTIYSVNDGDEIVVESKFPEIDYDLTFNLSEGCQEGFIQSVTVDNRSVENWKSAKVRVGSSVSVAFDSNNYKISKFDINGSPISTYGYYSPYTFTMSEDTTFDIEAAPYGTASMTIKVDKAEYVVVYKGYDSSDPSNVFKLNDGETTIEVSETISEINLRATAMATITSVTQDDSPLSKDYSNNYKLTVRGGSVIEVEAEEIRRDNNMVFYFDSPAKSLDYTKELYGYSFRANDSQRSIELEEGYNEIKFGDVDGQFMFTVNNGRTNNVFLYVNGETPSFQSDYVTYYFTPSEGDVLKCFVGERPESYTLSFTVDNGLSDPTVTVDKIKQLENLGSTTVLQGTHVKIVPADGETYKSLTVGDIEINPVDGAYEFVVNSNSPVEIKRGPVGAVIEVEADDNATTIYNLQGMRVEGDHLPAGIYIINGKKTLIR